MISTIPKQPLPHKESRFVADGLLTKGDITVFIYYHMDSSIYATFDYIKLERSRPLSFCPFGKLELFYGNINVLINVRTISIVLKTKTPRVGKSFKH